MWSEYELIGISVELNHLAYWTFVNEHVTVSAELQVLCLPVKSPVPLLIKYELDCFQTLARLKMSLSVPALLTS